MVFFCDGTAELIAEPDVTMLNVLVRCRLRSGVMTDTRHQDSYKAL